MTIPIRCFTGEWAECSGAEGQGSLCHNQRVRAGGHSDDHAVLRLQAHDEAHGLIAEEVHGPLHSRPVKRVGSTDHMGVRKEKTKRGGGAVKRTRICFTIRRGFSATQG